MFSPDLTAFGDAAKVVTPGVASAMLSCGCAIAALVLTWRAVIAVRDVADLDGPAVAGHHEPHPAALVPAAGGDAAGVSVPTSIDPPPTVNRSAGMLGWWLKPVQLPFAHGEAPQHKVSTTEEVDKFLRTANDGDFDADESSGARIDRFIRAANKAPGGKRYKEPEPAKDYGSYGGWSDVTEEFKGAGNSHRRQTNLDTGETRIQTRHEGEEEWGPSYLRDDREFDALRDARASAKRSGDSDAPRRARDDDFDDLRSSKVSRFDADLSDDDEPF